MAGKTTITSKGLVTQRLGNSGVEIPDNDNNAGFGPNQVVPVDIATAQTLVGGGIYVLSASGEGVSPLVMPTAASSIGTVFIFRNGGTVQTHTITGSQESAGTKVFSDGTDNGSNLQLATVLGSSVALVSDGINFMVLSNSGTLTFSGI